jgi:hypothetical protein
MVEYKSGKNAKKKGEKMLARLATTARGRILLHTLVMVNAMIHFQAPNVKFYAAALKRFVQGIG